MQRHNGAMGAISEGARLRDEGIAIAEAHAVAFVPDWRKMAAAYLNEAMRAMDRFQTADFRKWAELRGLPPPPDARAYGGIIKRAHYAGRLEPDGYMPKADAQCHASPAVIWKVVK